MFSYDKDQKRIHKKNNLSIFMKSVMISDIFKQLLFHAKKYIKILHIHKEKTKIVRL